MVLAATAVFVVAGCGNDGSEAAPTSIDLSPAVEAWLDSLPEEPSIWQRCPPGEGGSAVWEESFLGGWESLAAAGAPPDPVAGAWRTYLEAGNVWAAAVLAGVDEPAMLDGLRAAEARLIGELERWVERSQVGSRLALSEGSLPESC